MVAGSDSLSSCASGLHEKLDAALSLEVRAIGCAGMTRGGVCDVGGLPGVGLSTIHGPLFVNSEVGQAAGHRPRMKCSAQVIFGATLEPTSGGVALMGASGQYLRKPATALLRSTNVGGAGDLPIERIADEGDGLSWSR